MIRYFFQSFPVIRFISFCLVIILNSNCRTRYNSNTQAIKTDSNAIFERLIVRASKKHTRNSEGAIIVLKDQSWLFAWSEFDNNGEDHASATIVGKISYDKGRTWGDKYTLVENEGGLNVMEVNFLRLASGEIALFYGRKYTESSDSRIMMRTSRNEGKTWDNPKQLSPTNKYTGLTNGRSIRLSSGRILLELWEGGDSYCILSDDEGKTWRDSQRVRPDGGPCYENACIELKDGKVLMLMRTELGAQYKSLSSDGGETWSSPVATSLKGSASPVSISRIPDTKDILVIWNHSDPVRNWRNPITAAVSKDEGKTWGNFKNLETEPDWVQWAYPAVTWLNNRALITYYNNEDGVVSIKLKEIPSEWFYQ